MASIAKSSDKVEFPKLPDEKGNVVGTAGGATVSSSKSRRHKLKKRQSSNPIRSSQSPQPSSNDTKNYHHQQQYNHAQNNKKTSPTHRLQKDEQVNLELSNNRDIPDQLKNFLKELAYPEPDSEPEEISSSEFIRSLKEVKARVDTGRTSRSHSIANTSDPEMESSSEVNRIISEDLTEENVSVENLLRLKQRKENARFSKYELAILYSEFKDKFPDGKVNRLQLGQMLHQVFPKCESEHLDVVVDNIMNIFDHNGQGFIFFRDLLIAFSLSMKGSLKDRLTWSYRLYDEEGKGEIDTYDLERIIVRLCEFSKSADVYLRRGGSGKVKKINSKISKNSRQGESGDKPHSTPPTNKKMVHKQASRSPVGRSNTQPVLRASSNDLGGVKVLSSKMSERLEATKIAHKKQRAETPKNEESVREESSESIEGNFTVEVNEEERKRAVEVVRYLDANGDGFVSQEEFVQGCLDDEEFFGLASNFRGHLIWGELLCDKNNT